MSGRVVYVKANSSEELAFDLEIGDTKFGTSADAYVRFKGRRNVEKIHFILKVNPSGYAVILNKSKKWPVQVNGEEVQIYKVLKHNDRFVLDGTEFIYQNEKITAKVAEKVAAIMEQSKSENAAKSSKNLKKTPLRMSNLGKLEEKCKTTSKLPTKKSFLNTPRLRKRLSLNEFPKISFAEEQPSDSSRNFNLKNIPEEINNCELQDLAVFDKVQNISNKSVKSTDVIQLTDNESKKNVSDDFKTQNRPKRSKLSLPLTETKKIDKSRKNRYSEMPLLNKNVGNKRVSRKYSLPAMKESKRFSSRRFSESSKAFSKVAAKESDEEMHDFNEEAVEISNLIAFSDNEDDDDCAFLPDRKSVNKQSRSLIKCRKSIHNSPRGRSSSVVFVDREKSQVIANKSVNASVNKSSSSVLFDTNSEIVENSENEAEISSSASSKKQNKTDNLSFVNTSVRRSVGRPRKSISKLDKSSKNYSFTAEDHVTAESELQIDEIQKSITESQNSKEKSMIDDKNESVHLKSTEKRRVGRPSKRLSTNKNNSQVFNDTIEMLNDTTKNLNDNTPNSKQTNLSSRKDSSRKSINNDSVRKSKTPQRTLNSSENESTFVNKSQQKTRASNSNSRFSDKLNSSVEQINQTKNTTLNSEMDESDLDGDEVVTNNLTLQSSTPYAPRKNPRFTYNSPKNENDNEVYEISSRRRSSSVVFIDSDGNSSQNTTKTLNKSDSVIYLGAATPLKNTNDTTPTNQNTPENPIKTPENQFKTPSNTPRLFDSLRKSVLKSRTRLSVIKSAEKLIHTPRKSESPVSAATSPNRAAKLLNLAQNEKSSEKEVLKKTEKSPVNDLSNVSGVKDLFTTPVKTPVVKKQLKRLQQQKSPKNDLSNVSGVKDLMKLARKSPRNDLISNISGVGELFTSPKDLSKRENVRKSQFLDKDHNNSFELLSENIISSKSSEKKLSTSGKTRLSKSQSPKVVSDDDESIDVLSSPNKELNKSLDNDTFNISGIKELLSTPEVAKSKQTDSIDESPARLNKSRRTSSKIQKEPETDSINNVSDVKTPKIVKNKKVQKEPKNDLSNVEGVKKLFTTPKVQKEPKNDLSDVQGVKKLLKTPKVQKSPKNDLSNVAGVKKLLKTPKVQKEPKNDLSDVQGVKKLLKTPKIQKQPKNDLSDVEGVKKLFKTAKVQKSPKNDLSNVSGVNYLFNSPPLKNITNKTDTEKTEDDVDLFDKVANRRKLRTYSAKSPSAKSLDGSFVSDGEPAVKSFVKDWVVEQNSAKNNVDSPEEKKKKRKNNKENEEPPSKRMKNKKQPTKSESNEAAVVQKRVLRPRKKNSEKDVESVNSSPAVSNLQSRKQENVEKAENKPESTPKKGGRRNLYKQTTHVEVKEVEESFSTKNNEEEIVEKSKTRTKKNTKAVENLLMENFDENNVEERNKKPQRATRRKGKAAEAEKEETKKRGVKEVAENTPRKTKRGKKDVEETKEVEKIEEVPEKRKRTRKNENVQQEVEETQVSNQRPRRQCRKKY